LKAAVPKPKEGKIMKRVFLAILAMALPILAMALLVAVAQIHEQRSQAKENEQVIAAPEKEGPQLPQNWKTPPPISEGTFFMGMSIALIVGIGIVGLGSVLYCLWYSFKLLKALDAAKKSPDIGLDRSQRMVVISLGDREVFIPCGTFVEYKKGVLFVDGMELDCFTPD
jgi:hypothetical protein